VACWVDDFETDRRRQSTYSAGGYLADPDPFSAIFHHFGQFQPFLGRDFPFFDFFPTSSHVKPMQPNRGRTIAHRQQELKPRNWAPEVTGFFNFVQLVDLGLKRWFSWVQLT
jgi:hypothetical protein